MAGTGLVDSHCHLADPAFDADREVVLSRARAAGVTAIVVVAAGVDTAGRCLDLARTPGLFATAGVHPHRASEFDAAAADHIAALLEDPRVVAVGETGLDYHYDHSPRKAQREAFVWHLARAAATGKPAVIHSRDADADTARLLADAPDGLTGVLHCFSAGPEVLDAALARGLCVSRSGMVTFKTWDARWALERVPDDAVLVETDAPYLAPVPHRGTRNEPGYVAATAARLAELRGIPAERLAEVTAANARRLFHLPGDILGEGS
ncbi:MAG: TatD family hydrolase [Gemmatimonadota bacterium]